MPRATVSGGPIGIPEMLSKLAFVGTSNVNGGEAGVHSPVLVMKKHMIWRVPAPIGVKALPMMVICPAVGCVAVPYLTSVIVPRNVSPGSKVNCVPNITATAWLSEAWGTLADSAGVRDTVNELPVGVL